MKKIFAVLSVVAMLFTSCVTPNNGDGNKPKFPEKQSVETVAGENHQLTFSVDADWTISLPAASQSYAYITYIYEEFPESSYSGAAGEHTITVHVRTEEEGVLSYSRDIVINIEMTIGGYTETIATYTIPRTEYPVNVQGLDNEGTKPIADFSVDGHPKDTPFADAYRAYTIRYYNSKDAVEGNKIVQHDLHQSKYNYNVYIRDDSGKFVSVDAGQNDGYVESSSWVQFIKFGLPTNSGLNNYKFRLSMNNKKWKKTPGVGYEAYVNLEDENGNALVSVYHVYNPDEERVIETSFGLANPELAAEKGITLTGKDLAYTLTYPTKESFTVDYMAAALKFGGYTDVTAGMTNEKVAFARDGESENYYLCLAEGTTIADVNKKTETLTVSAISDAAVEYTITVVFDWVKESDNVVADGSVSFVNVEAANEAGATLEKLDSTSADYNSEWGVEHQYHLTYTSNELLAAPAKAALNVPGFGLGTIVNIEDMSADHFNYSEALELSKDAITGEVLLSIRKDKDGNAIVTTIPNGKCELFCCDADGNKFARILFELNVPATDEE